MQGKVLLISQRRISTLVAFCLGYEFEDTLAAVTNSERFELSDRESLELSRRAYKYVHLVTGSSCIARRIIPPPRNSIFLKSDFELFFPVFNNVAELYRLAAIPDWRRRCGKAACFITEVWSGDLDEYQLEQLSAFDHIFLGTQHTVEDVARITNRPSTYLPLAVDVLRFTPTSLDQLRPISVCNIGRRSQVTHQALLEEAERRQLFYYYDTIAASGSGLKQRTFSVDNAHEHRGMLATLLKHSLYLVANRARVNEPELTKGCEEISSRYYEGAAAGTVMIGETPRSDEFKRQFDWPDAVIQVPFDCPNIGDILADLNGDPERLRAARHENARHAALKHDWLYRIRAVFDLLDLKPTERMQERAYRLDQIASRN